MEKISDSERLIAFEAAMQELGGLQQVAHRYRPLRRDAEKLLSRLFDLGAMLRKASRHGPLSQVVVDSASRDVLSIRDEWRRRLEDLRVSELHAEATAAFARGDQGALRQLLPALLADLEVVEIGGALYQSLPLTVHGRAAGASPFRAPAAIGDLLERLRTEGLVARPESPEWWDADLPSISFRRDLAAVDGPAALEWRRLPADLALFADADVLRAFAASLRGDFAVVLALSSEDAWWEAKEGSYERYRDALRAELESRSFEVRFASFGV